MADAAEIKRLRPELFRRVPVPYFNAFRDSSRTALLRIVSVGLADARIARKQAVHDRLMRAAEASSGPEANRHLDEFAEDFGFLEQTMGSYFAGEYGLIAKYIEQTAQRLQAARRSFSVKNAEFGLLLYALLDRHGDCLLAALRVVDQELADELSVAVTQSSLNFKLGRWLTGSLPRNAAYRVGLDLLVDYAMEWGAELPPQVRPRFPALVRPDRPKPRPASKVGGKSKREQAARGEKRSESTLNGYFQRSITYATDLGFIDRMAGSSPRALTVSGSTLVRSLREAGLDASGSQPLEIPPSFEAIHDAFSIDYRRYESEFHPAVSHSLLERIVGSVVLPAQSPTIWSSMDLEEEFRAATDSLSESLTGAARLDAVRLALFIFGLGTGTRLDLQPGQDIQDPNAHAAARLGLANPNRYLLGHARTGTRLWTVALLRR